MYQCTDAHDDCKSRSLLNPTAFFFVRSWLVYTQNAERTTACPIRGDRVIIALSLSIDLPLCRDQPTEFVSLF